MPKTLDNPSDYDVAIRRSKIHGYGVFTKKDIKKGTKILPYNYKKKNVMKWLDFKAKYGDDVRYTYMNRRKWEIICVKENRNIVTYINDGRPKENCMLKGYALYAKRDIKKGEELTIRYTLYHPTTFNKKKKTVKKTLKNPTKSKRP